MCAERIPTRWESTGGSSNIRPQVQESIMANTNTHRIVVYRDGDGVVFCDRDNPDAWIKSDVMVTLPQTTVDEESATGDDDSAIPRGDC